MCDYVDQLKNFNSVKLVLTPMNNAKQLFGIIAVEEEEDSKKSLLICLEDKNHIYQKLTFLKSKLTLEGIRYSVEERDHI